VARALIRLLVLLLVLAGLAVVADRVAARLAGRAVADGLTTTQKLGAPATVSFPDVPFLTQAIHGRYDTVEVSMPKVPTEAKGVVIDRLDATLHGVTAPAGPMLRGEVTALPVDTAEARATVTFATLETAAKAAVGDAVTQFTLSRAAADRVALSAVVQTPLGPLPVKGAARITVSGGAVRVRLVPESLTGVPAGLRQSVAGLVDLNGITPELPYGFRVSGVTVDPVGLRVTASGRKLTIPL
jgi:hypothetical protein